MSRSRTGAALGTAPTVNDGNALSDFAPDSFTIMTFCESCGDHGELDRGKAPEGISVQKLPTPLRCSKCGAKAGSIRILYTGAGGFRHT